MPASHYLPTARYTVGRLTRSLMTVTIRVAEWPTRARSRSAQFVCMTLGVIPELEAMIESTGGVSVSFILKSRRSGPYFECVPQNAHAVSVDTDLVVARISPPFAATSNGSASPTRFSRALNALPTRLPLRRYMGFKP